MVEIVQKTRNPYSSPMMRAAQLVSHDTGIDIILNAPPSMTLGASSGRRKVFAQFLWGLTWNGEWYVRGVRFSTNLSSSQLKEAEKQALKERLLDRIELDYAKRYNPKATVFPAEENLETFVSDLELGDAIVASLIQRAHEAGQGAAKLLENPITPLDLTLDLIGFGVGKAGKASEKAAKLENAYERVDGVKVTVDAQQRGSDARVGEKSKGDAILETAVDLAGLIPGAGPFINVIAGFVFDVAIANQAGAVTRIRSRAYSFLIAGFIGDITLTDTGVLKYRFDRNFFMQGQALARRLTPKHRYQVQLSLLHYASDHYTDGGWGGLTYLGYQKREWLFPDHYLVNWSPRLLGAALATQLPKIKYLVH